MSPLEREIARQRHARAQLERRAAAQILTAYSKVERRLEYDLAALTRQIEKAREQGIEVRPGWLYNQERYRTLIGQLHEHQIGFLHRTQSAVSNSQQLALQTVQADVRNLTLLAIGPGTRHAVNDLREIFNRLPDLALTRLIGRSSDGQPLGRLLANLGADSAEGVKNALAYGVAAGKSPRVIAREVRSASGMSLSRALTISRTEMLGAYRQATTERFQQVPQVVQGWYWACEFSERTCMACIAMDGTFHDASETLDSHPSCFPAGTLVSGPPPVGATARHYDGEIIVVRFASGDELAVTPNHPILTARGWVAAGELHEGCDVIRCGGEQRPMATVDPDHHEGPVPIEDVAEALRRSGRVATARVPAAAEHFHGDGLGGEVDVVWAEGLLRDRFHATFAEPFAQEPLSLGVMLAALLARQRPLVELAPAGLAAPGSLISGPGPGLALLGRAALEMKAVGVPHGAQFHSRGEQTAAYRRAADAEALGDGLFRFAADVAGGDLFDWQNQRAFGADLRGLEGTPLFGGAPQSTLAQDGGEARFAGSMPTRNDLNRFAGEVVADRVVDVGRRSWSGHVFNLQTLGGWYIANRTLVHNCRCTQVPATASWADLGFDIPDNRPSLTPAAERFDAAPEEMKLAMMGRAKLEAYSSGEIALQDLVHRTESRQWGPGLREASLKQALAAH